uniref:Nondiscriminating glutamyl-tRNA synthetase EARS2, mitochondrial n=1 Tax=Syphacia muris TaxID=451379 RepID=A0A158R3T1_9BILA
MIRQKLLLIRQWWFLERNLTSECRVRFAPSPTGQIHLGSLRTALFNYLFAKSSGGKFILRIEDTDRNRIIPDAHKEYECLLNYFGLSLDEGPSNGGQYGPYFQSQRLEIYKRAVQELVDQGSAYYCFCSSERLNMLRRNASRMNEIFRYDNRCRSLSKVEVNARLRNCEPHVVRFKLEPRKTKFKDEVFGEIEQTIDEGDFVIFKSDGYPTYHLANVVDDHYMKISHVIRGMEWISSTPKHIQLYNAFGWPLPRFAHLPLITKNGSRKLSKRDKDAFVNYYTNEKGYLPIAVLNFLIRNGSGIRNFDNTRLYSLKDMEESFDLSAVGRRNFMMDETSLNHYGELAFEKCSDNTLYASILNFIKQNELTVDIENLDNSYLQKLVSLVRYRKEHFPNLSELLSATLGYLSAVPLTPEQILEKFDSFLVIDVLNKLKHEIDWNSKVLKEIANSVNLQHSRMFMLVRLCLTGNTVGPPVKDLINFFGQVECHKRIDSVINMILRTIGKAF